MDVSDLHPLYKTFGDATAISPNALFQACEEFEGCAAFATTRGKT